MEETGFAGNRKYQYPYKRKYCIHKTRKECLKKKNPDKKFKRRVGKEGWGNLPESRARRLKEKKYETKLRKSESQSMVK